MGIAFILWLIITVKILHLLVIVLPQQIDHLFSVFVRLDLLVNLLVQLFFLLQNITLLLIVTALEPIASRCLSAVFFEFLLRLVLFTYL